MSNILEIENLKKVFKTGWFKPPVIAVDDLSFAVEKGEIFGFLGPNGAGKTTTINILMNFINPTSGTTRVLGGSMKDLSVRERVGFISENPVFYDYLNGAQNLFFLGKMFGISNSEIRERTNKIAKQLSLDLELRLPLKDHSKGMLQRIGLAQSLINNPELLVLDEPMSGLDPIGRKEFKELLLGLRESGKTVFFSSHILADVAEMCDRVGIVAKGRLIDLFKMEDFRRDYPEDSLENYFVEKVQGEK